MPTFLHPLTRASTHPPGFAGWRAGQPIVHNMCSLVNRLTNEANYRASSSGSAQCLRKLTRAGILLMLDAGMPDTDGQAYFSVLAHCAKTLCGFRHLNTV
jgi:hypothetical protein